MIKISKISQNKPIFRSPEPSWTFVENFSNILRNFFDIPRNLFENSSKFPWTFPRIFSDILSNLLELSPESSRTFPGIFLNIPLNLSSFDESSFFHSYVKKDAWVSYIRQYYHDKFSFMSNKIFSQNIGQLFKL